MDPLYKDLLELPAAPSFEKPVRDYMRKVMESYHVPVHQDKLGSIFAQVNPGAKGPRVMVAGHMDEVGGLVVGVTKQGLIKLMALGGMNGDVFLSQRMNIITDEGIIPGVTASKPPHLTRGDTTTPPAIKFEDLLLDIGADSEEHAKELGVKVGQQVISENQYTVSKDGKKIFSKAWDNRFGAGMALDLLKTLHQEPLDCELFVGATVQEEVGLRGAQTATYMLEPDIFIAVDASPCADVFGGDDVSGHLGKGFLVRFVDPVALMHQGIKKHILEVADQHKIKYQHYQSKGGTDAAKAQLSQSGVVVATIGMPARYIHSNTSMIHLDDYQAVKDMLVALIKSINETTYQTIQSNV
jgi:putative aminopeptidase FrvX